MKHILPILTAALALAATPVFADFNFELQWRGYENTPGVFDGTAGKYFTIKVTGDEKGKIFLTNYFDSAYQNQSEVLDDVITNQKTGVSVKVTDFGYKSAKDGLQSFSMTDSDHIVDLGASSSDPNMQTYAWWGETPLSRKGYYLGEFTAGDEIQVYLKAVEVDADGKPIAGTEKSTTSYEVNGQHNSNINEIDTLNYELLRANATKNELLVGSLYIGNKLNFGIVGTNGNGTYVYGTLKEVTAGAAGSPLPGGVQIALIAGLFGLGFWYIRRRKSVVA
ncbi:MAG: hypothetical protein IKL85_00375 [Lentisphaeria bacterium]|nr:hypothetical protein [Lentisphaeria bacterium]